MAERTERKRNILRNFYGTAQDDTRPSDPLNIDDPTFDVDKYMSQMLATNQLSQLMKTEDDLLQEIQRLDGAMKTLVIDNYSKFIRATDTVRIMKTNVENMEEEMNRLEQNMEKITQSASVINTTLAPSREKICELSGVHRLLKKRQFLFELPTRLRKAIELKAYDQAVTYFTNTSEVLKKYSSTPSLHKIQQECEQIMETLKTKLYQTVSDDSANLGEVANSIGLLLDLKESTIELRKQYIEKRGQALYRILETFEKEAADAPKPTSDSSTAPPKTDAVPQDAQASNEAPFTVPSQEELEQEADNAKGVQLHSFITRLNKRFLDDFLAFCTSFQSLFIYRSVQETTTERSRHNRSLVTSSKDFTDFVHGLFDKYSHICRAELLDSRSSIQNLISGLKIIKDDLTAIHQKIPEVRVNEVSVNIVGRTIQELIETDFKTAQSKIRSRILHISSKKSDLTTESTLTLSNDLLTYIEDFIHGLQPLFVSSPSNSFLASFKGGFLTKTAVNVQQFFLYIEEIIDLLCEGLIVKDDKDQKGSTSTSSTAAASKEHVVLSINASLLLARSCLHIIDIGVPHIRQLLDDIISGSADSSPAIQRTNHHQHHNHHHHHDEIRINAEDLSERLKNSSQKLLGYYVKLQGQLLSQMIRKGLDLAQWLKVKETREVRQSIVLAVAEMRTMKEEISAVFDANASNVHVSPKIASPNSPSSPIINRFGFEQRIGDIFAKKIQFFGEVAANAGSILMGILKIALKSFIECVRLQTFGRNGYQQIQVDAYYVTLVLRSMANDAKLFDRLVDDILVSASDRCVDPQPLEQSVVRSICESTLKQNK